MYANFGIFPRIDLDTAVSRKNCRPYSITFKQRAEFAYAIFRRPVYVRSDAKYRAHSHLSRAESSTIVQVPSANVHRQKPADLKLQFLLKANKLRFIASSRRSTPRFARLFEGTTIGRGRAKWPHAARRPVSLLSALLTCGCGAGRLARPFRRAKPTSNQWPLPRSAMRHARRLSRDGLLHDVRQSFLPGFALKGLNPGVGSPAL